MPIRWHQILILGWIVVINCLPSWGSDDPHPSSVTSRTFRTRSPNTAEQRIAVLYTELQCAQREATRLRRELS